ncbi:MAG: biosynthetic-type acetolactate synthase large subunit [bacterium]|nr:biosynthetic-type acetolactate synthase large subunit [bacterium]
MKITGAEAVIECLLKEHVTTIFGYPGGANMPIYDALYKYQKKINHILVRHEQGATHAAEGYSRVTGKPGVCFATSGPGATNLVTGIADAMMDSIPMVCVTGQVAANLLGSDAFQETDVIGITAPITKWNFQITKTSEIPEAFAKAFYIASHGRPGPVVLDIVKSCQFDMMEFKYPKKVQILKFERRKVLNKKAIKKASEIINRAKKPYILSGHGVLIANATEDLKNFAVKIGAPVAVTLHGISSIPCNHPQYIGMLGMHGNFSPNVLTNEADVIVAIGMRFDDRVTGKLSQYAPKAKIIHIDVDPSEHHKNIRAYLAIAGDAKKVLQKLNKQVKSNTHKEWMQQFKELDKKEFEAHERRNATKNGKIRMDEVFQMLSKKTKGNAIIVADVGQNQMFAARHYQYTNPNSYITSGGLGTMGFALPAAIGAKIGSPKSEVIATIGDGGFQMTIQELGTIMQEKLPVKIIVLNNHFLGMVRQWQQLFFDKRYSFTTMVSPDFVALVKSYGISAQKITKRNEMDKEMQKMLNSKSAYFLEIDVENEDNIFPMMTAGSAVDEMRLE